MEMKGGRVSGPRDIVTEMIKNGGPTLLNKILTLTHQIIPTEWKICYISSLYKEGDKQDSNSYSGLNVTSTMSRLWGKIMQKRIKQQIDKVI